MLAGRDRATHRAHRRPPGPGAQAHRRRVALRDPVRLDAPDVGFDDGLERTIAWYRDNEAWWRKLEWMKDVPVRTASGEVEYH